MGGGNKKSNLTTLPQCIYTVNKFRLEIRTLLARMDLESISKNKQKTRTLKSLHMGTDKYAEPSDNKTS